MFSYFSNDFKESLDQEAKNELENVYDKTHYIINNIENEWFNKGENVGINKDCSTILG